MRWKRIKARELEVWIKVSPGCCVLIGNMAYNK